MAKRCERGSQAASFRASCLAEQNFCAIDCTTKLCASSTDPGRSPSAARWLSTPHWCALRSDRTAKMGNSKLLAIADAPTFLHVFALWTLAKIMPASISNPTPCETHGTGANPQCISDHLVRFATATVTASSEGPLHGLCILQAVESQLSLSTDRAVTPMPRSTSIAIAQSAYIGFEEIAANSLVGGQTSFRCASRPGASSEKELVWT